MRLLLVLALAACPGERVRGPAPPPADGGNRLTVVVIVDQLPQWAFRAKRPHLTGGVARLLREGTWTTGVHPSPATITAVGHALIGSGEPPWRSGILANEWWDRDTERMVKSVEDPAGGVSAVRMRVPGLGAAVAPGGKAVGIALKERAAILPLGAAGIPIWYDKPNLAFASQAPRPWLAAWNAAHPLRAHLDHVWEPLDRGRIAALSGRRDDEPGEVGETGFGPTFPHAAAATKDPAETLFAMPIGNDLVFDVAEAALAGEQLGADATPDVLVLSLSAYDHIGHGWGHESWESWDATLRLDARLDRFLAALDAKVGAGRWSLVLTSDHGGPPLPELAGGGRITYESLRDAANQAAIAELGPGEWVASAKYPFVWLTAAAREQPDRQRDIALRKIMLALRSFPGIEQVGKSADFARACDRRTGDAAAICQMIDPERAGEVFYLPKRGWMFQKASEPLATTHGSQHAYDREVPLIVLAPGRTAHAPLTEPSGTRPMTEVAGLVRGWVTPGRTYTPRSTGR